MRLLVAMLDVNKAQEVERCFQFTSAAWDTVIVRDGEMALSRLDSERYDLFLLHEHLPKVDGNSVFEVLLEKRLACPPRILLLREAELYGKRPAYVDCVVSIMSRPKQIAALLEILAKKNMPSMAVATRPLRLRHIEDFLSTIGLRDALKGWAHLLWLLDYIVPSPLLEHQITATLYPACAAVFSTTAAAVERCVRHAVEEVFTKGSIHGIEQYFGMTVDPERGKLTNKAFLLCAAEQLRTSLNYADYSLARLHSSKSIEIHHSPAAPTRVYTMRLTTADCPPKR